MAEKDINWDNYTHRSRTPGGQEQYFHQFDRSSSHNEQEKLHRSRNCFQDFSIAVRPDVAEIGRDLCRVKKDTNKDKKGGYRNNILAEKMAKKLKAVLICKNCEGIMKEACISSSGEQLCSGCDKGDLGSKQIPNWAVRETINSLKCYCPLFTRGCLWLGTLEKCENHLDMCGYVYETCELGCEELLKREEFERHEKDNCSQRQVKCDHCDENFRSCELEDHLDKCPKMKVSCNLCNTKIPREEMEQHLRHDCVQRIIQCENCFIDLIFCDNSKHLEECPEMKVLCDQCSVEKYRKDMTQHLEDDCPENMLDCPFVKYKCLARIKRKDIDKHLEEKETKHLGLKLTAMEDLITQQSEINKKQSEEIKKQSAEIIKQNEESTKQSLKITKQNMDFTRKSAEIIKQSGEITKHRAEITKQNEESTKQSAKISKQNEESTKQSAEITKQNEESTKQSVEIIKQSAQIIKQGAEINQQRDEINKQSAEITKQRAEINILNENFERQNREMKIEKSKTSQQIELLYSITNSTKIIWKIEDATDQFKHHLSTQYEVAGFALTFQNKRLIIVFPGTMRKPDRPFIARCHIVLHSRHTINCGMIEVKQKEVLRGCERLITSISQEDVDKYSEPRFPGATRRDLTLEIFITIQ